MAALAGCEVIDRVSSTEKGNFVTSLGATQVVQKHSGSDHDQLQDILNGQGVDLIADGVGPRENSLRTSALLAPFGKVVLYGAAGGLPEDVIGPIFASFFNSPSLVTMSEMTILNQRPELAAKVQLQMLDLLHSGKIHPNVYASLLMASVQQAHAMLEDRKVMGRIILVP